MYRLGRLVALVYIRQPSAIGAGYYVVLSRIVHLDFRELLFHALG